MRTVLVIDDDPLTVKLMQIHLRAAGYHVLTAADGQDGLDLIRAGSPDLVLLDMTLPSLTGIKVLQTVRQESCIPVIMLSGRTDLSDKLRGLSCGADDYITKPFRAEEVLARIDAVLRRSQRPEAGTAAQTGNGLELDPDSFTVIASGGTTHVTPNEYRLLEALLKRRGRTVSRYQLAEVLDPLAEKDLLGRAVDVHITRLRKKLRSIGVESIATVRGLGYRWSP